ncbi:hypothetical protein ACHAWF_011569 [Thalassiosira exigua]
MRGRAAAMATVGYVILAMLTGYLIGKSTPFIRNDQIPEVPGHGAVVVLPGDQYRRGAAGERWVGRAGVGSPLRAEEEASCERYRVRSAGVEAKRRSRVRKIADEETEQRMAGDVGFRGDVRQGAGEREGRLHSGGPRILKPTVPVPTSPGLTRRVLRSTISKNMKYILTLLRSCDAVTNTTALRWGRTDRRAKDEGLEQSARFCIEASIDFFIKSEGRAWPA